MISLAYGVTEGVVLAFMRSTFVVVEPEIFGMNKDIGLSNHVLVGQEMTQRLYFLTLCMILQGIKSFGGIY